MLNLSHVHTFLAVVDEGGIQLAASRLACSQPAVSRQLSKLEEFLGVSLVLRNRTRSVPTKEGALFVPKARALIEAARSATTAFSSRRLSVYASGNVGVFLAPRIAAGFERDVACEGGGVDLVISTNRGAIDALSAGQADVALTEWHEDDPAIEWTSWRREKLVVIAAPTHPLASFELATCEMLVGYSMIGGEPGTGTGRALSSVFGDNLSRLNISRNLGSTAAVKEAVKANLGISIVFECAVADEVRAGTLVTLGLEEADIFKRLYVGIHRECPQSSLARDFASYCANSKLYGERT
ncbi:MULTISPECIES: LysR family transcriptional regulator [unclassified Sulfitobacter]|uniref:LysR family transcriptional regulator n=1 Tax=Roseibium aggregatum TaxID=187304 RepID=A0A939ECI6_9HYPH|nr:LysR family transcriptional regulator [Roseibium aggregatum]